MAHLSMHFSADYENLVTELGTLAKAIESAEKEKIALDHRADFYAEFSNRFIGEESKLNKLLEARNSALAKLGLAVTAKQTKAFTSLECPVVEDQTCLLYTSRCV